MIECWECGHFNESDVRFCAGPAHVGDPTPLRLARYQVLDYLGHGTFGRVYKCLDPTIDRIVAVKKLAIPGAGDATRALDEMRIGGRLDHPNIVRVFDADVDRGLIVMEYMGGGSLAQLLHDDPSRVRTNFTQLFMGICEGLRAAHVERLIHRDIKPANILLTQDGQPKLADFGVARVLREGEMAATRAGSPAYMAPEVLLGEEYGLEADIHSLGCVMYEAWTGQLPFRMPGRALALALQKQQASFTPLREVGADVDDVLNELVDRMLTQGSRRIKSVETVIQQLRQRDPQTRSGHIRSIDDMQLLLGSIYSYSNSGRSPLVLLGQFHVAIRALVGSLSRTGPDDAAEAEALFPRAFAWLCALATALNARLGQLIWVKYDGSCPYCGGETCICPELDRKKDSDRNRELLALLHDRRLGQSPAARTFAQYQAMFRRIYGEPNERAGAEIVGLHAHSEIAEAVDALLHLTGVEDAESVTVLHLEISDLVAWFFALLNLHSSDYSFQDHFEEFFKDGCYACRSMPCICPPTGHERALINWRELGR